MFVCDSEPTPSSLEIGDIAAQLVYTCEEKLWTCNATFDDIRNFDFRHALSMRYNSGFAIFGK